MMESKDLEKIVIRAIESKSVDQPSNGYPPIHHILINLHTLKAGQGEEEQKHFNLLQALLSHNANPNIFDHPGMTPLQYVFLELSNERHLRCREILLKYKADINQCSRYNTSTLAVFLNGKFKEARWSTFFHKSKAEQSDLVEKFLFLYRKSDHANESFRKGMQQIFDDAVIERSPIIIDLLLQHNLATFDLKKFLIPRVDFPEWFQQGCWIRKITKIDQEIRILSEREKCESLLGHTAYSTNPTYTKYSPSTFIISTIGVRSYPSPYYSGVFIKQSNRTIAYWYDGLNGEKTTEWNHINYSCQALENKELKGYAGVYNNFQESFIPILLEEAYEKKVANEKTIRDCHGILSQVPYREQLPWNEGLFRYQYQDIVGIYVNPDDEKMCENALVLKEELEANSSKLKDIPFYYYDTDTRARTIFREVKPEEVLQRAYPGQRTSSASTHVATSGLSSSFRSLSILSSSTSSNSTSSLSSFSSSSTSSTSTITAPNNSSSSSASSSSVSSSSTALVSSNSGPSTYSFASSSPTLFSSSTSRIAESASRQHHHHHRHRHHSHSPPSS